MPVRLPDAIARFAARGARLRQLSKGHAARDWLTFLATIADGQRVAAERVPVPIPTPCGEPPPLRYDRLPRDASWREMLAVVIAAAKGAELPDEALQIIDELAGADPRRLEALADRQLGGALAAEELGVAPFVGAALQAWFAVLARSLDPAALDPRGSACPACGGAPVAGFIDAATRRRYLSCSLCSVDWNVPRLTCVSCGDDSQLTFFGDERDAGVKAEACGRCRGYVKLFDLEKRPGAEPMADDAATLALDVLVAKEGYERIGSSLWLAVVG